MKSSTKDSGIVKNAMDVENNCGQTGLFMMENGSQIRLLVTED